MGRWRILTDDERGAIEMALSDLAERTALNLLARIEDGTNHNAIAWAGRNLGTIGRMLLELRDEGGA